MMDSPVVYEGYLNKSPKRPWKSHWSQRYFVLKESGQIPGQYVLEYYADKERRKLKGSINLDECEQVDAGLSLKFESGAKSNKHVFDIITNKRTYYFGTKTEEDMYKWVECICAVCGLKQEYEADGVINSSNHEVGERTPMDVDQENQLPDVTHSGRNVVLTSPPVPSSGRPSMARSSGPSSVSSPIHHLPTASSSITDPEPEAVYLVLEGIPSPTVTQPQQQQHPLSSATSSSSTAVQHHKNPSITSSDGSTSSSPYIPISECHSGKPPTMSCTKPKMDIPVPPSTLLLTSNKNSTPSLPPHSIILHPRSPSHDLLNKPVPVSNSFVPKSPSTSHSTSHLLPSRSNDDFYDIPRPSATSSSSSIQSMVTSPGNVKVTPPTPTGDSPNLYQVPPAFPSAKGPGVKSPGLRSFDPMRASHPTRQGAPHPSTQKVTSTMNQFKGVNHIPHRSNHHNQNEHLFPYATMKRSPSKGTQDRTKRLSSSPTGQEYMNMDTSPSILPLGHNPPPRPPKPATLRRNKNNNNKSDSCISLPDATEDQSYDIPRTAMEAAMTMGRPIVRHNVKKAIDLNAVVESPFSKMKLAPAPLTMDELYDIPRSVTVSTATICSVNNNQGDGTGSGSRMDLHVPVPAPLGASPGKHAYLNAAPGFTDNQNVFRYDKMSTKMLTDPPAVDRNLKPRRKGSESDATNSPTTELNYLDLDHVSPDTSSPRTPNLDTSVASSSAIGTSHHSSTSTLKSMSHLNNSPAKDQSIGQNGRSTSGATVYKLVDFVKTKALNDLTELRGTK